MEYSICFVLSWIWTFILIWFVWFSIVWGFLSMFGVFYSLFMILICSSSNCWYLCFMIITCRSLPSGCSGNCRCLPFCTWILWLTFLMWIQCFIRFMFHHFHYFIFKFYLNCITCLGVANFIIIMLFITIFYVLSDLWMIVDHFTNVNEYYLALIFSLQFITFSIASLPILFDSSYPCWYLMIIFSLLVFNSQIIFCSQPFYLF